MAKPMEVDAYEADSAFDAAARLPVAVTFDILGMPSRLLARIGKVRRHRQAMWELSQLDDRMLKDIGVERSEIPRVALYGRATF